MVERAPRAVARTRRTVALEHYAEVPLEQTVGEVPLEQTVGELLEGLGACAPHWPEGDVRVIAKGPLPERGLDHLEHVDRHLARPEVTSPSVRYGAPARAAGRARSAEASAPVSAAGLSATSNSPRTVSS